MTFSNQVLLKAKDQESEYYLRKKDGGISERIRSLKPYMGIQAQGYIRYKGLGSSQ